MEYARHAGDDGKGDGHCRPSRGNPSPQSSYTLVYANTTGSLCRGSNSTFPVIQIPLIVSIAAKQERPLT